MKSTKHPFRLTTTGILSLLFAGVLFVQACRITRIDSVGRLTNEQFMQRAGREGYRVIDVRTPKEYDSAHIENATLMNWLDSAAFYQTLQTLDPHTSYLLYCRTGKRSLQAARAFKKKGIKKVYDLTTGIKGWTGHTVSEK